MGVRERALAIQALRGQIWSPGRPSIARREDRVRFWRAIARGASTEDASAEAGVSSPVGSRWFRQAGGMPPQSLLPLSVRHLTFAEREEIAILHAQQHGVREIARRLRRSPSTISRELRRNAATRSHQVSYRATTAQWHAERRASRPKVAKLAANPALRDYVQDRLAGMIARPGGGPVAGPTVRIIGRRHGRPADRRWARAWSPEQISHRLRIDFPDDASMRGTSRIRTSSRERRTGSRSTQPAGSGCTTSRARAWSWAQTHSRQSRPQPEETTLGGGRGRCGVQTRWSWRSTVSRCGVSGSAGRSSDPARHSIWSTRVPRR